MVMKDYKKGIRRAFSAKRTDPIQRRNASIPEKGLMLNGSKHGRKLCREVAKTVIA